MIRTMKTKTTRFTVLLVLLMAGMTQASLGEVGMTGDADPLLTLGIPYIIFGITEDPEPIGKVWEPFNTGSPNRFILNADGFVNGDGAPSLVFNRQSDMVMVAWARNSAEGFDVVLSTFDEDAWSDPVILAGDGSIDALDPHLSVDPADGTVHLYYWLDDAVPVVMHRQAPADLSTWSDPEQVSDSGQPACRPHGLVHQGVKYVTYELHDYGFGNTPRQVVLASDGGDGFQTEVVAVTHQELKVCPEVHARSDSVWVDWIDSDSDMSWAVKDSQTGWGPLQYETYSSAEDRDFNARTRIRQQVIE